MDIAETPQPEDTTMDRDGLKVFVQPMAMDMLATTTIDFKEGYGFVLTGMQPSSCSSKGCSSC